MTNLPFFDLSSPLTINQIATLVDGKLVGRKDCGEKEIKCVDALDHPASSTRPEGACVYASDKTKLENALCQSFSLCFINRELALQLPKDGHSGAHEINGVKTGAFMEVDNEKLAFAILANALYQEKEISSPIEHQSKELKNVNLDPSAIIAQGAVIGKGTKIGPYSVLGPDVRIGEDCIIDANVTITCGVIGDRVHIESGVRIGQAGFGFVSHEGNFVRMPQLGRVIIGDDVEIGANTTIDRGALEDTIIGRGCKIDNLVQIGHNVVLGENCILAAQTGISGSCRVGNNVMFGGKAGLADHLTIGDGAKIAANAGCKHDIPAGETWAGAPAKPVMQFIREVVMLSRLTKDYNRKTKK